MPARRTSVPGCFSAALTLTHSPVLVRPLHFPPLFLADLCRALADKDANAITNEAVDLVAGKMMSWPTDKVLPGIDLARALLIDPKIAGRKGQTAMGAYSMAYAGEGGPTPEKIATAQQQDVVLRIIMSAATSEGKAPPPAPVVCMYV